MEEIQEREPVGSAGPVIQLAGCAVPGQPLFSPPVNCGTAGLQFSLGLVDIAREEFLLEGSSLSGPLECGAVGEAHPAESSLVVEAPAEPAPSWCVEASEERGDLEPVNIHDVRHRVRLRRVFDILAKTRAYGEKVRGDSDNVLEQSACAALAAG